MRISLKKVIYTATTGYLILICLMVFVSISLVTSIHDRIDLILHDYDEKIELVSIMRDAGRKRTLNIHRMLVIKDPFEREDEALSFYNLAQKFIKAREKFSLMTIPHDEQEFFDEILVKVRISGRIQNKTVDLILDDLYEEALDLSLGNGFAMQVDVIDHFTDFITMLRLKEQKIGVEASFDYGLVVTLLLFLGAIMVVLLGYIAYRVLLSLRYARGRARYRAKQVSDMNLELLTLTDSLEDTVYARTKELAEAQKVAESASNAKSNFLANMSHEIRTPLNAIIGMCTVILKTRLAKKQKEYIHQVFSASDLLLNIVNEILDFSKLDSNKLEIEQIPFNLDELLAKINSLFINEALKKELSLSIATDTKLKTNLIGDPMRLEQVLVNLTSNAVKFTKKGQINLSVTHVKDIDGHVELLFSVSDTGVGMKKEQIDKLFVAFTQADSTITRKFGGTGLGLAISKQLVEKMNGEIRVKSRQGIGSSFEFSLIFKKVTERRTKPRQGVNNLEYISGTNKIPNFSGSHALLVEDNESNQLIAGEFLKMVNLKFSTANNGQECLDMCKKQKFDLVIMDLQMPVMDGYTATQKLRENFTKTELPIIAMTANAMEGDKKKCLAVGMNDYLSKPIIISTLFEILKNYLSFKESSEGIQIEDSSEEEESEYPAIDGIDMVVGLENIGGSLDTFYVLLEKFIEEHANFITNLKEALEKGDIETAFRYVHTLKGLSGTIGAKALYETVVIIVEILRKGEQIKDKTLVPLLDKQLSALLKGMQFALDEK